MDILSLLEKIGQVQRFESGQENSVSRHFGYTGTYRGYFVELHSVVIERRSNLVVTHFTIKGAVRQHLCEVKYFKRDLVDGKVMHSLQTAYGLNNWYADADGTLVEGKIPEELNIPRVDGTLVIYIVPLLEGLLKFSNTIISKREEKTRR